MMFNFQLNYSTQWGESIQLVVFQKDTETVIPMNYISPEKWGIQWEGKSDFTHYCYQISTENNTLIVRERHQRKVISSQKTCTYIDAWIPFGSLENIFDTIYFKQGGNQLIKKISLGKKITHLLRIKAQVFDSNHRIVLSGDHSILGEWNETQTLSFTQTEPGLWELPLSLSNIDTVLSYKCCVYSDAEQKIIAWETGENRLLFPFSDSKDLQIHSLSPFRYPQHILPKEAGVAIPVFSLRTQNSWGVGEFSDLISLGKWADENSISLIQILPINDTIATHSWTDSYPYAAISVYALNPIYISIQNLPYSCTMNTKTEKLISTLNAKSLVDWEAVMQMKWNILHSLFDEQYDSIQKDKNFIEFYKENKDWLEPYALFCSLRDTYKTADFSLWESYADFSSLDIATLTGKTSHFYKDIQFHTWVQFHLHIQLEEAIKHLHSLNIKLKGDLPIGIYRHSVEAWKEPELFGMDFQAGAPPDDFSVLGQNWEFPTYNWEKMKENGYQWWKNRFAALAQYFDALRIDHILGFFRIWRIPIASTQGLLGYFYPALAYQKEELHSVGIFDVESLCVPCIDDEVLRRDFQEKYEEIINEVFNWNEGKWKFKTEYNSQRKIIESSKSIIKKNSEILLHYHTEVLFIQEELAHDEKVYHPRIHLYQTIRYERLKDYEKKVLYDLHNEYFYHRNEALWKHSAMQKLPQLIQSTDMLICGEDLGLVPNCVPEVMQELGILSLQVQRMTADDTLYSNPAVAPYLTVVTPATHDTSTIRQWWEEDPQLTSTFYHQQLGRHGQAPDECSADIMFQIIAQHLYSPALLSIIPIQEYLALTPETTHQNKEEERINVPAVFPHYWRYRMPMFIEKLASEKNLHTIISSVMQEAGRG